ncbi:RNA polymerase sigma-H factor [Rubritalea halochordaticola]|uniref:RNA polymerase sigma-H factor n=2 Tax=Rubritalea halochordaticola TaxID=714537 RepID=A0ABP9V1N7_9BACT
MSMNSHIIDFPGGVYSPGLRREDEEGALLSKAREQQCIQYAQQGHEPSFRLLMEMHEVQVYQLCRRLLGCPDDAMEACQDVFVKAYRALPDFDGKSSLSTWLYRIAVNHCRDDWKSAGRRFRQKCLAFLISHGGKEETQGARLDSRDDLRLLEEGMQSLPSKYRAVLILTSVEGMSHEECAECLGCSVKAVEGRLYRARKRLEVWWQSQP